VIICIALHGVFGFTLLDMDWKGGTAEPYLRACIALYSYERSVADELIFDMM
jgi:hypothetical protein